jgi:hypothetical protein
MASTSKTSKTPPVARFRMPGEIAAVLPMLVGFVPTESVVVVSLRRPRKRVGLSMRIDLPAPEHEQLLAEQFSARLRQDRAMGVVVAVYTDEPDDEGIRPRAGLVAAIEAAAGVPVTEALLVRGDRWWSYFCANPDCCPPEGTPVGAADTPALSMVNAQCVLDGRSVLSSRQELVDSIAAPQLLAAVAAGQQLDAAAVEWSLDREDPVSRREAELAAAKTLLDRVAQGEVLPLSATAAFAIAVHDVLVRDQIATWSLDRADDLLALLQQVARQVVPPYDAPVCTLLAWVAYAGGNGGLANVALDRALSTDPEYALAGLLRTALDGQISPVEVRKILRGTRTALRSRRRRT